MMIIYFFKLISAAYGLNELKRLDSKSFFSSPRCKRWKNEVCICKVEFKLLSISSV